MRVNTVSQLWSPAHLRRDSSSLPLARCSANVERTTESPFNIGAVRLNLREAEYVIVHKGTESDIFI